MAETEEQKVVLMAKEYGKEARKYASTSDTPDRRRYLEAIKLWSQFRSELREPEIQKLALDAFRAEHNKS